MPLGTKHRRHVQHKTLLHSLGRLVSAQGRDILRAIQIDPEDLLDRCLAAVS